MPYERRKFIPNWRRIISTTEQDPTTATVSGTETSLNITLPSISTRNQRKMTLPIAKISFDPIRKIYLTIHDNEVQRDEKMPNTDSIKSVGKLSKPSNSAGKFGKVLSKQTHYLAKREQALSSEKITAGDEATTQMSISRRNPVALKQQTARSQSASSKGIEKTSTRRRTKPYHVEKGGGQYTLEQKKKRKMAQNLENNLEKKSSVDKIEIQKRLEDLRKKTRRIVENNLLKSSTSRLTNRERGDNLSVLSLERELPKSGVSGTGFPGTDRTNIISAKSLQTPANSAPKSLSSSAHELNSPLLSPERTPNSINIPSKPQSCTALPLQTIISNTNSEECSSDNKDFLSNRQKHSKLLSGSKRVGLLRKPDNVNPFTEIDDSNATEGGLDLNIVISKTRHTNVGTLEDPVLNEAKRLETVVAGNTPENVDNKQQMNPFLKLMANAEIKENCLVDELQIPDVSLRNSKPIQETHAQEKKRFLITPKETQKPTEMPQWLKPTGVQSHPYNFIVALRRKLESVINQRPTRTCTAGSGMQESKQEPTENVLRPSKRYRAKRRLIQDDKCSEEPSENTVPVEQQKSCSDVISNFSSISIQIPETVSTFRSDSPTNPEDNMNPKHADENDTTASSFTLNSSRKENSPSNTDNATDQSPISPLYTKNISNLHVKSSHTMSLKNVNLHRGDDISSHSLKQKSSHSEGSVDFSVLLGDFNRSLSQVVDVNYQLKKTLAKSQHLLSPEKRKNREHQLEVTPSKNSNSNSIISTENIQYASDFEDFCDSDERHDGGGTATSSSIPEIPTESINSNHYLSSPPINIDVLEKGSTELQSKPISNQETQPCTDTLLIDKLVKGHSSKDIMMPSKTTNFPSKSASMRSTYIKTHINTSRGEFQGSQEPPPVYQPISSSQGVISLRSLNLSPSPTDADLIKIINKSDIEVSMLSFNHSSSQSPLNYSSVGMYEKLIQTETHKLEQLTSLLKKREKALIDRTKNQIALLEIQKDHYKAKGLASQISAVKKKQRGILLKMEKERDEIKKLLQQAKHQTEHKHRTPNIQTFPEVTLFQQRKTSYNIKSSSYGHRHHHHHHQQQHQEQQQQKEKQKQDDIQEENIGIKSSTKLKGFELATGRGLEKLLLKREEDLRRRREHVEKLMEWHRRLDEEETELLQLEKKLFDYNNVQAGQRKEHNTYKRNMERKLKEIDKSLRELSSISTIDETSDIVSSADFIRTTGTELNKLWRRLTSQRIEKFEPNQTYKLNKGDLEKIYEEAKLTVLRDFQENTGQVEMLLNYTSFNSTSKINLNEDISPINLNFNSGQSDVEIVRGNYNPSEAEEEFLELNFAIKSNEQSTINNTKKGTCTLSSSSQPTLFSYDQKLSEKLTSLLSDRKDIQSGPFPKKSKSAESLSMYISDCKCKSKLDFKRNFSAEYSEDSVTKTNVLHLNQNIKDKSNAEEGSVTSAMNSRSNLSQATVNQTPNSKSSTNDTSEHFQTERNSKSYDSVSANVQTSIHTDVSGDSNILNVEGNKLDSIGNNLETNPSVNTTTSRNSLIENFRNYSHTNEKHLNDQVDTHVTKKLLLYLSKSKCNSAIKSELTASSVPDIELGSDCSERDVKSITTNHFSDNITNNSVSSIAESILSQSTSGNISKSHKDNVQTVKPQHTLQAHLEHESFQQELNTQNSLQPHSLFTAQTINTETPQSALCLLDTDTDSKQNKNYVNTTENIQLETTIKNNCNCSRSAVDCCLCKKQVNSLQNYLPHEQANTEEHTLNPVQSIISKSTSIANHKDFEEEDCDTLNSIKSIDISTNSKHSINLTNKTSSSATTPLPPSRTDQNESHRIGTTTSYRNETNQQEYTHEKCNDHSQSNESHHYSSNFDSTPTPTDDPLIPVRSSVITYSSETPQQAESCQLLTDSLCESELDEREETFIENITPPSFNITTDDLNATTATQNITDLEKRLMNIDDNLKDLNATFEKALSPEKVSSRDKEISQNRDNNSKNPLQQQPSREQNENILMPDIINEVELRRRQQLMTENEMKQFEHTVPYMYVREIPNKPPPPYVPPAHGSPMTTIFPSEDRIKYIANTRTKELYCEMFNIDLTDENGKKPPSVLDENITNIYERIILDICKECLNEYKSALTSRDPHNFHSPLAFYNPPDRLKCIQDFIYKKVRKSLAMDEGYTRRNHFNWAYNPRGKRDHIGEIIIEEMFEEDDRWSNFYTEEEEVLEIIISEMIGSTIAETVEEVLNEEVPDRKASETSNQVAEDQTTSDPRMSVESEE